jgi:fatty acid desaturase
MELHAHEYLRNTFRVLLAFHIFVLFFTREGSQIQTNESFQKVLNFCYSLWPFPTMTMSMGDKIDVFNIITKIIEIGVITFYSVDVLPKIFVWKKPVWWKTLNAILITSIVVMIPMSIVGFQNLGLPYSQIKLKVMSLSLSLLLFIEIVHGRDASEEEEERVLTELEKVRRNPNGYKNNYFTWEEIIEHDRRSDCWAVIHGKVYDLTNFVDRHPGGEIIYDGAGGDCTPMWESYHPYKLAKARPPEKYCIGYVRDYNDFYSWGGEFYDVLRQRVEAAIPHRLRRYDPRMYIKTIVILVLWFMCAYYYFVYNNYTSAIVFGLISGQIGVNIMHDGNHMAYSNNKWMNTIAGACIELLGTSCVIYKRSHDFGHHGCVNHLELDRAFDTTFPLLRLHKGLPRLGYHKWQWLYGPIAYSFVNFGDMFGQYDEIAWLSNYPVRRGFISVKALTSRTMVAALWLFLYFGLPVYMHGYTHMYGVWFVFMCVFGHSYVWFFAVNHWTTEAGMTDFMNISQTNWGVLQVENSCNFGTDLWYWNVLSGGLNYQIEHHLFPGYIHTRLPELHPIVKKTCEEYGMKYTNFPTFSSAILSNIQMLYNYGQPDEDEEDHLKQD